VPIDLNLTVYADPAPTIRLFKDGQRLASNNEDQTLPSGDVFTHYRVLASRIEETGLYEYRINNSYGSTSYSKHINFEKQPPFIQPIANQTVVTGTPFTLACYASGQPYLQLKWIDETTQQVLNTSSESPLLLIATTTQPRTYTCQGSNAYGESTAPVHVSIQIPAKILSFTSNRTMRVNETLNVSCTAQGDHPLEVTLQTPQLRSVHLIETENDHQKSISFTIEQIRMSDNGLYKCEAKNHHSEARSVFELIVQNIPDRIDKIFVENANRISWVPPFNGNAKILKYVLRIQYRQGIFCIRSITSLAHSV
jgi:hypothetical protein